MCRAVKKRPGVGVGVFVRRGVAIVADKVDESRKKWRNPVDRGLRMCYVEGGQ